ncbi:hypothetical protein IEO21_09339 [Rhodonia placenta]|uniref:Uncharacterized protein n=1 Tax=Rhodonia placenta TaxID=104341 RepID=A0A8H7TYJ4_9APHY|nr:hypothetical protein IEO21_09339 [Postia placenta]
MRGSGQAVQVGSCAACSVHSMLMQPQGLVSHHDYISKAQAVLCTAAHLI